MTDKNWRDLILSIKADYGRVGRQKAAVLKTLEQWLIFPNKFVTIADTCADLQAAIISNAGQFRRFKTFSQTTNISDEEVALNEMLECSQEVYRSSLQLSLLTPVLAEAFINMTILVLCKKEIRNNKRHLESFIRSHIDTKVFDLPHKCDGFVRFIDPDAEIFRNFKRVMDKRNNSIHGNCDPEREQLEVVYFEGTRPLFKNSGDHIGKFLESRERQYPPEVVLKDYEDIHKFLYEIIACLQPSLAKDFMRVMEDGYPGYDVRHQKMGSILPGRISVSHMEGVRYDDELDVDWG